MGGQVGGCGDEQRREAAEAADRGKTDEAVIRQCVEMLDGEGELIVGGARSWAKIGAQKEVRSRLCEAAGSTCMWQEGDMRLERMKEKT